jgi:hypothetical protein
MPTGSRPLGANPDIYSERIMSVQANEAAKCYEEKVVLTVADANIGSLFGYTTSAREVRMQCR